MIISKAYPNTHWNNLALTLHLNMLVQKMKYIDLQILLTRRNGYIKKDLVQILTFLGRRSSVIRIMLQPIQVNHQCYINLGIRIKRLTYMEILRIIEFLNIIR